MSIFKKARQLVSGRINFDTLCRYAAHNLNERRKIEACLAERKLCPVRKQYLENQLYPLTVEKDVLVEKYERIISKVSKLESDNFLFII